MMRRVDDFVKSEEVFKNTELPKGEHPERLVVTQFRGSHPPRHSYGSRPSMADIYRRGDHYQPYVTPRAPDGRYDNRRREVNHLRLDSLTKLPSEILATELKLRLPPCPSTVAPQKKGTWIDGPLIVEAEVEAYWIRRVFVDQGAAVQVMFAHCFDNLSPDIKARLTPTQTELVGFSGEQLIPIGRIELKVVEQEETIKEKEEKKNRRMEEEEKVLVNSVFPEQTITIGTQFFAKCREQLVCLLKDNMDVFAWQPSDMGGVPRRLVRHGLNVNHSVPLVVQKRRVLGIEKILVKKADDTWRMCIDFKNLTSACPKDYYPLPQIDLKIEAVMGASIQVFYGRIKGVPSNPDVRIGQRQDSLLYRPRDVLLCEDAIRHEERRGHLPEVD
nr:hypothetical protein [Tanacetum cinerariifolium]